MRSGVQGFDPVPAAVILLVAVAVAASLLSGRPVAAFALASAGAAGLAVEMLAIVIIQASTGLSWMLVGAVTGMFMSGAAIGAVLQVKGLVRSFRPILLVSASGSGTAALAVLLYDGGVIGGGMLSTAMIFAVLLTGYPAARRFLQQRVCFRQQIPEEPGWGCSTLRRTRQARLQRSPCRSCCFP